MIGDSLSVVSQTAIRPVGAVLIGMIVAVLAMIGIVFAVRVVTLPIGLRPDGPACEIEEDPGSGPSNQGTEQIDWGLLPERVCVAEPRDRVGPPRAWRAPYTSGPDLIHLLSYPLAFVAGSVIGVFAGIAAHQHRSRPLRDEAARAG